ncbi:MAG: SCO family protein [Myxococcota bacterium]|nr:SCO family protein [Myxococcota bacterium]
MTLREALRTRLCGGLLLSALLVLLPACNSGSGSSASREALPNYGEVPPFELVDQAGSAFGSEALAGKVWAAGFIFTRCPSICPVLTALMHEVEEKSTAHGTAFRLVSFSVDPAYDTPEVLTAYATSHNADLARWSFLTGPPGAVEETVVGGMKISMGRPTVEDPITDFDSVFHGTKALLIDQKMQIRGYYALEDRGGFGRLPAVDQLIVDAEFLMAEGPGS